MRERSERGPRQKRSDECRRGGFPHCQRSEICRRSAAFRRAQRRELKPLAEPGRYRTEPAVGRLPYEAGTPSGALGATMPACTTKHTPCLHLPLCDDTINPILAQSVTVFVQNDTERSRAQHV